MGSDNINNLIKGLKEWNDGKGIDAEDWITCVGDINFFIGYSTIFYPTFYELNNCIFLGDVSISIFNEFHKGSNNLCSVEATINHRHIIDFFPFSETINVKQIEFVATLLKKLWLMKLNSEFPNKKFIINIEEGSEDDLEGYQITFYQKR